MSTNRWVDTTQPQTLLMATILLYVFAGESLILGGALFSPIGLAIAAIQIAAGFGIANEKKWGYYLGVIASVIPVVWSLLYPSPGILITLMFEIALVCLLLHPQSREYQRIWFK